MRFLPLALIIALACTATTALAQNENTTLAMHGLVTAFGPCDVPDPCDPGPPTVNVPVGGQFFAYLLARNYNDLAGVQTAFDWGAWAFVFGLWDCQPNQLFATTPGGGGGPTAGTISTAFDCVQGGATAVVGRFALIPTAPGCVVQVESTFPEGTHMVNCLAEPVPINELNRGSVCAGSDGVNACDSAVPVEATTWGNIKSQYAN